MPPISRSATSVVVTSITPAMRPEETSFSIACPPVPVAWKTRQSQSSPRCRVRRVTHGVVTPNMVMPRAGLSWASSATGGPDAAMPAMARAALASTTREMRLRPAMSVTEYIMAMSLGPT